MSYLVNCGLTLHACRTKSVRYVEENLGALKIKLSTGDVKAIRQAITETELTGDQYPPGGYMEVLYLDTPEPSEM